MKGHYVRYDKPLLVPQLGNLHCYGQTKPHISIFLCLFFWYNLKTLAAFFIVAKCYNNRAIRKR